jgi:hypothetical protein
MLSNFFRFFYILFTIFFKRWEINEIIYLRNELLLFFSSSINIIFFFYFLFAFYILYIIFLFSFLNCGFSTLCWISSSPIFILYVVLILMPFEFMVIYPFIKNFICNIKNFIYFCILGKIKID